MPRRPAPPPGGLGVLGTVFGLLCPAVLLVGRVRSLVWIARSPQAEADAWLRRAEHVRGR